MGTGIGRQQRERVSMDMIRVGMLSQGVGCGSGARSGCLDLCAFSELALFLQVP